MIQCQTSGSQDPTVPKPLSFPRLMLLMSSERSCSLVHPTSQETETISSKIGIQSHSSKSNALINTKRKMSLLKNIGTKKSATILHAVPEAPEVPYSTAPPACEYVGSRSKVQPVKYASSHDNTSPSRMQSSSSPALSSKCLPIEELKSVLSNPSLKGAIGIYKQGKIHWRQRDRSLSSKHPEDGWGAKKSSRPKINVVIPSGPNERPLPATPSINKSNINHIITASIHCENHHDVSPPSSTNPNLRNSIVSPLPHAQPVSFGQFQRSMSQIVRKPSVRPRRPRHTASKASGSSADSHDSDSASTYSNRSSETSVEANSSPRDAKHLRHYTVQDPVVTGVFNTSPDSYLTRFKAPSTSQPRRYAHHPPVEQDKAFQATCPLQRTRNASATSSRQSSISRKSSKRGDRRRSLVASNGVIDRAISRSTSRDPLQDSSPTLSEAENDLEEQLTSFTEESEPATAVEENSSTHLAAEKSILRDEVTQRKTVGETVAQLPSQSTTPDISVTPPIVPRKSSKRKSAVTEAYHLARAPRNLDALHNQRVRSRGSSQKLALIIPERERRMENVQPPPKPITERRTKRNITPACAEDVLLHIFRSLEDFDDLFATAVVNQGFHRVFKRHELDLIRTTLRSMSPPAWEFREIAWPGHDKLHDEDLEMTRPQEEYTPTTYLQLQKRDTHIIRSIKSLIKESCQSFIRPEIAIALVSGDPAEAARVDDALWRIWTFCKLFGSGKGREEDIVAQQDWLRGGLMVHQPACTFSLQSTDYMNDTLIGAPECFAKGNEGGLTAEQLFDMMELWNCLGVLLQGFEGRTAQAREYGIFDNTDVRGGDIDGEEMMLGMVHLNEYSRRTLTNPDEWCYYLLTNGLSAVLDLAGPCRQMNATPFKAAAQQGWTNWNPPEFGGSRRNFLREAASRVYEDKIANTYATTSTRDIQRHMSKQRIQKHITEIRHRKQNEPDIPMIRMSQERPMSEWSTVIGNLTRPRLERLHSTETDVASHVPIRRSFLAQELTTSIAELSAEPAPSIGELSSVSQPRRTRSPTRRIIAEPLLPTPPPSTVPSTWDRNSIAMSMPSIEEHPAYRRTHSPIPAVPSLINHPAFRHRNPVTAPLHTPDYQYPGHSRQSSNDSTHSAFQQHPTQHNIRNSPAHENTAQKAIYRIVEMGFTAEQARKALKITDLGDGLRVDRAVELLLSGQAL
jgi:hypothetical protein